jgi:predicted ATP-grasp superfamily ATP-dependent carboligase
MPDRTRILVPADEFHASLALVRGLRSAGYLPVLAVSHDRTYAARSRAVVEVVRVPSAEDEPERFAAELFRTLPALEVSAILPGTEASMIALSRVAERLQVRLGAPAPETVELATDKPRVLELAAQHGLPQPASAYGTPASLCEQVDEFRYPVVLKPQRTRMQTDAGALAYFKAKRIDSADALKTVLGELPEGEWVVQPYVSGGLCAISGVAWEGRIVAAVHQRSARIWPRDIGYSCYAETTPADRALEDRLSGLLHALGWSGLFQLQMLRQDDGSSVAIDFNPRPYGSLALAIRAGANLPAIWAALVLGDPLPPTTSRPGVRYRLETGDAKSIATLAASGQLRAAAQAAWPRRDTAHAIFSLRDPAPVSVLAFRALARLTG